MKLRTPIPALPRDVSCAEFSSDSPEPIQARRILVADDDEFIRQLVSTALADDGFAVSSAADGEEAWEALHREHYDLLVTDNEMPRLAGINLIERIRKAGMSLPVIIASGTFPVERVRGNPQLQIAGALTKPFGIPQLLDSVHHVLPSLRGDTTTDDPNFHGLRASPPPTHQPGQPHHELCED
jgi:DNA-binding NtrC family response regulator